MAHMGLLNNQGSLSGVAIMRAIIYQRLVFHRACHFVCHVAFVS